MKKNFYIFSIFTFLAQPFGYSLAEFSLGTYMQADNDLEPFAAYNVKDMMKAPSNANINMIVQWDQPNNNKTWRYSIGHNSLNDIGSLDQEMGINPANELVNFMTILKTAYPAKKYGCILWNHGNGALDRSGKIAYERAWLSLPSGNSFDKKMRGILYDYSQKTYLATHQFDSVFSNIKSTLGQNLDFLGMDACLMAMVEFVYPIMNSVNFLVASQQTEDGLGWPYAPILTALAKNSTMDIPTFAQTVVHKYDALYSKNDDNYDSGRTQSAINVSLVPAAVRALDNLCQKFLALQSNNRIAFKSALKNARAAATEFYITDYIDLYSLYLGLEKEISKLLGTRKASVPIGKKKQKTTPKIIPPTKEDIQKANDQQRMAIAAQDIIDGITIAKRTLLATVIANKAGEDYQGGAYGLSIYFPSDGNIDSTYAKTSFAMQTSWTKLISSVQ